MNHTKSLEDKLQIEKEDRRLLPNVPDPSGRRTNVDRRQGMTGEIRNSDFREYTASAEAGRRFRVSIPVTMTIEAGGRKYEVKGTCEDISSTGMLLTLTEGEKTVEEGKKGERISVKITEKLRRADKLYKLVDAKEVRERK